MRIIHAVGWYFPNTAAGTEVYVAGLCRRLRAAGHEIMVAAPLAGAARALQYQHEGVTVYRYPVPARPSRDECSGKSIARGAECFHAWMKAQEADWVHFHSFTTGLGIHELASAQLTGARVMVTNHLANLGFLCQRGTLMRWGEALCDGEVLPLKCAACVLQQKGLSKAISRVVAKLGAAGGALFRVLPGSLGTALSMPSRIRENQTMQQRMLKIATRFVVLNQWAFDALIANGAPKEKLSLNYLGVSHVSTDQKSRVNVQPTSLPIRVGYVGRIVPIKGVVQLAEAFSRLPSNLPIRLDFRGPTDDEESRQMVAHLKMIVRNDARVTFSPSVTSAEVPEILASYDLLCIPSIWFENGPTVMLESHAAGTPVLGSAIGAMQEVITDGLNGRLVPPGDVPALVTALLDIVSDPSGTIDSWREKLPKARTMDEVADDYLKLYNAV